MAVPCPLHKPRCDEYAAMTRLLNLDALRGFGLLFMIVNHAFDWWLAPIPVNEQAASEAGLSNLSR